MQNKLGLNNIAILEIEDKLVEFKMSLLNEYFTFNIEKIDINYIQRLHEFLFIDLYEHAGKLSPRMTKIDIEDINEKINNILENINYISYNETKESIMESLNYIIDLQPFIDGNFRTLKSFLNMWFMANDLDQDYKLITEENYRSLKIINKKETIKKL